MNLDNAIKVLKSTPKDPVKLSLSNHYHIQNLKMIMKIKQALIVIKI